MAVSINGLLLEYINPELSAFRQIVLRAIKQNRLALAFAPLTLKQNRAFTLQALEISQYCLEHLYESLQNDKALVRIVVQKDLNGNVFKFASYELRGDKELVKALITNCSPRCLAHANDELRADLEIAGIAMRKDITTLKYFIPAIQERKDLVELVKNKPSLLSSISEKVANYKEIALFAIKSNPLALQYMPNSAQTYDIALAAVQQDGTALEYVRKDLQTAELVGVAIDQNGYTLKFADKQYQQSLD